jgi:hypothetical protein
MALYEALDPVRLLHQLSLLQDALWRHATLPPAAAGPTTQFNLAQCGGAGADAGREQLSELTRTSPKRMYRRTAKSTGPRTYRTRPDPFAADWEEIQQMVAAAPERTATSILQELQQRYPGRHPDGHLRTLQRRISAWRATALLVFTDGWLAEDAPLGQNVLGTLRLQVEGPTSVSAATPSP